MEKTENCEECNNRFQKLLNKLIYFFDKRQKVISKTEAFNEVTYGKCMTREQFILHKQTEINSQIRSKVESISLDTTEFDKYFLTLSLTNTEEECSKEIFSQFIVNGYKVEKISGVIPSLQNMNVYILSWKKN